MHYWAPSTMLAYLAALAMGFPPLMPILQVGQPYGSDCPSGGSYSAKKFSKHPPQTKQHNKVKKNKTKQINQLIVKKGKKKKATTM